MRNLRTGDTLIRLALACMAGVFAAPGLAQESTMESPPPAEEAPPSASPPAAAETPPDVIPVQAVRQAEEESPAATTEDAVQLDAVMVTVGKRAQALDQVAGSVSALGGKELEGLKAQSLGDYLKRVPGVVLVDRGADGGQPIIRGIATSTDAFGSQFTQLPVGIYVDDMPFTDLFVPLSVPDLNPFDLERVEVLKGPQGTLFGSGALAGAIRYIPQKPKLSTWEGKLGATHFYDSQSEGLSPVYAGALNIPLLQDDAAVRIVGLLRRSDGRIDEYSGEGDEVGPLVARDVDKVRQPTGRALVQWNLTERFNLSALYFTQETRQLEGSNADNPRGFDRVDQYSSVRESGVSGLNLSLRYRFDWAELLSSSNLQAKDIINHQQAATGQADPNGDSDGDGGANGPGTEDFGINDAIRAAIDGTIDTFFQEFRLTSLDGADWQPYDWTSLRWLAGISYQRSDQYILQETAAKAVEALVLPLQRFGGGLGLLPIEGPTGPVDGTTNLSVITAEFGAVATEKSIYGEIIASLFEDWELTLGARLFETALDSAGYLAGAQATALDGGSTRSNFAYQTRERGVNPKISLRYLLSDSTQIYALAAKGFQFGGVQLNPPLAALSLAERESFEPYKSSVLWNYEIGLRTQWFGRKLQWDITAFRLDWTDLQLTVRKPLVPGGEGAGLTVGFTENVSAARSHGVETALSLTPLRGLNFTSSVAWISARTTEDYQSNLGDIPAGTRLPASPRFQMSNVLSYSQPFELWGAWEAGLNASHSRIGGSYNDLIYSRPQGDYQSYDAGLSLRRLGERFEPDLSVSMINITDERGVTGVDYGPGARDSGYYFIPPRTLVLSLGVKF